MFEKILIANRGEIACRAIETCKKMGIKTVAVASTVDSKAKHVQMADESVLLNGNTSAETYLVIDKIIDAVKSSGAQAVYPGYGFLSENADFAQRLSAEGIAFIGPNIVAIEAMGDKIASKKLAIEAGVNTVPGYTGEIESAEEAAKIAEDIGYPVMIKASAGGGGKGMRVAYNREECIEGFQRARSEAQSSFGDDRIFVEKFIEKPRHIEIQVLADQRGNTLYINERECSIQRRHQKVIEEAPSPFVTPELRQAMGEQAVQLAKAVGYHSAGTVEFITDQHQNFYFLEMNTRLQVEHPVSEMITGIDLVEQMIRVAAGEPLEIQQSDIGIRGWAMETRIYAEMPERGFLPSTGGVHTYQEPSKSENVRVDSGIVEGAEVSMYYDPMIAKLITWGENRTIAIQHMKEALDAYVIEGVGHNINFLQDVLRQKAFIDGDLSTNFIAEHYPDGFSARAPNANDFRDATLISAYLATKKQLKLLSAELVVRDAPAWENYMDWVVVIGEEHIPVRVMVDQNPDDDVEFVLEDGSEYNLSTDWSLGESLLVANIGGSLSHWQLQTKQGRTVLSRDGVQIETMTLAPRAAELFKLMPAATEVDYSQHILSPMPGKLIQLNVSVGDTVEAGQCVAVIEAMKMENQLVAERAGEVAEVLVAEGDSLQADEIILTFAQSENS